MERDFERIFVRQLQAVDNWTNEELVQWRESTKADFQRQKEAMRRVHDHLGDVEYFNLTRAVLDAPIEDLNLPMRTYNALRRNGISDVGGVLTKTREQLLKLRNFGEGSLVEVLYGMSTYVSALGSSTAQPENN